MKWRKIHHNFLIDNYAYQEAIDSDDGTANFQAYNNVLIYGNKAQKADYGGHNNESFDNLYAYIYYYFKRENVTSGHVDINFHHNKAILTGYDIGQLTCTNPGKTTIFNNQYYTTNATIFECGMTLNNGNNLCLMRMM